MVIIYCTSIFFFHKIIFNWEFSRSKLLASHANKSTVQSVNEDARALATELVHCLLFISGIGFNN